MTNTMTKDQVIEQLRNEIRDNRLKISKLMVHIHALESYLGFSIDDVMDQADQVGIARRRFDQTCEGCGQTHDNVQEYKFFTPNGASVNADLCPNCRDLQYAETQ